MPDKQVGLGSLVKVAPTSGGAFTTIALTRTITPPARTRAAVDGTALADTLATNEPGIEEHSTFECMAFWHAGEANGEILDTLFGDKTKTEWQILYPYGDVVTDEFEGWVSELAPETIEVGSIIARKFTVQRTGAIARATAV